MSESKNLSIQQIVIMMLIALVTTYIGRQLLKSLNMSIKDLDFKYNASNPQQNWIDWMTPLAKEVGGKMGLPWQALVVQTAIETGWGKSSLFSKYNNFGGIKATGNQESVLLGTKECSADGQCWGQQSKFAVYATKYEGLIAYANFFHKNRRYKTALQYPNDPYAFITEIKKAGYATDPNYTTKLHTMLNKYFA